MRRAVLTSVGPRPTDLTTCLTTTAISAMGTPGRQIHTGLLVVPEAQVAVGPAIPLRDARSATASPSTAPPQLARHSRRKTTTTGRQVGSPNTRPLTTVLPMGPPIEAIASRRLSTVSG